MGEKSSEKRKSAFKQLGFTKTIEAMTNEIQDFYLADEVPWVIGYSGGKDSTAVLNLVWLALAGLEHDKLKKNVHVITTDTLVENPIVAAWANGSLNKIAETASEEELPILPHLLKPEIRDSFWVNLIGKGYPAPRHKFRWCTERLKIKPSTRFIQREISDQGEVILLIGTRKAESAARAHSIKKRKRVAAREKLTTHVNLTNCHVYTPIEDWSNDDVWTFLMQIPNQWNYSHKDLLAMYRGATADNECPLVIDTSTPSCGSSRFGCWVCTLVEQDKSMTAMVQNDEEKGWLQPLLELRNELDFRGEKAKRLDRERRDFRRLTGNLSYYTSQDGKLQLVPGPYTQESREYWLWRLLDIQRHIKDSKDTPPEFKGIELIGLDELQEIRRIWITEKHEIEDNLPEIYEGALDEPYPASSIDENLIFDSSAFEILRNICGGNKLQYELARNLLDIERNYRTKGSRRGLFSELEKAVKRCYYENKEDALEVAQSRAKLAQTAFVSIDGAEINPDGLEQMTLGPLTENFSNDRKQKRLKQDDN